MIRINRDDPKSGGLPSTSRTPLLGDGLSASSDVVSGISAAVENNSMSDVILSAPLL
jgi:hypothetical protein